MFKSFVRTVGLTCLAGIVGFATEAQGAATVSVKAVAKNGVLLPGGPTNALSIAPNDAITVKVFFSGWGSPPYDGGSALVKFYQASLLGKAGAISNGGDINNNARLMLPVGWDAPVDKDQCPCTNPTFPTCNPSYGCVGPNHLPNSMASINISDPDYIFRGFSTFPAVSVADLNVKWGATIDGNDGQTATRCQGGTAHGESCTLPAHCSGGTCNANFQSYGGTLNLKAGSLACGEYTFSLVNNVNETFIANPADVPFDFLPAIVPLILTVTGVACPPTSGACCDESVPGSPTCSVIPQSLCTGTGKRFGGIGSTCSNINPACAIPTGACCVDATGVCTNGVTQANCAGRWGGDSSTCATLNPSCSNTIIAVSPTNCLIDARIPHLQGAPAQRRGYTSMVLTFANPPGAGEDAPADFEVTQVPPPLPNPPTINNPVVVVGNTVTLNFSGPIQGNHWTCIRHIASNKKQCIGFLSADANSNRAALPNDILDIIDSLNGVRVGGPLLIHQCDIDRSGICLPADIIVEIDLLNGNGYTVQNAKTLEVCPSAGP